MVAFLIVQLGPSVSDVNARVVLGLQLPSRQDSHSIDCEEEDPYRI